MGAGASTQIRDGLIIGDRLEKMAHACVSSFEDSEFDLSMEHELLGPRFLHENPGLTLDDVRWLRPKDFGTGALFRSVGQRLDGTACLGALDGLNKDLAVVLQALCFLRPDYLRSIFVSYNAIVGCCAVRLHLNGRIELVVIDDRIPCRKKPEPAPGQPPHLFEWEPISCRLTTGEAWLPLIEKALAKLHGSYTSTAFGDGCRDLFRDLCGGEHVLDINLATMKPDQLATLFTALHPRFVKNELAVVARKSYSSTRTWAKKQRCNSVFNLVLFEDETGDPRTTDVNSYGADVRYKTTAGDAVNVLGHCVNHYGDPIVDQIYANAANTSFQAVPNELFADVLQQSHMLGQHWDETTRSHHWDNRRFFVCVSQDEIEPVVEDVEGRRIQHALQSMIDDANAAHHEKIWRKQGQGQVDADTSKLLPEEKSAEPGHLPLPSYSPTWLSWQRFCEDYEQLVVCVLPSDGHACKDSFAVQPAPGLGLTMKSAWDPHRGTSGGGHHLKSWRNSPLFRISLKAFRPCKGRLLVTSSLPDARRDAYYMDAIPDIAQWDGTQYHGGRLLYPAHALFVCQDEPTLRSVIVNTDYCQQRDVTVEMDLDLHSNGPFSFVVVPCTYADEIRSDFFLSSVFIDEAGGRLEVSIDPLEVWAGYNYTAKVCGQWVRGQSAMGPVGKFNPYSFLNPCWRMIIAGPSPPPLDETSAAARDEPLSAHGDGGGLSGTPPRANSPFNGESPGKPVSTILEGSEYKTAEGGLEVGFGQASQFSSLADNGNGAGGIQDANKIFDDVGGTEFEATGDEGVGVHKSLSYEDVDRLNHSSLVSVPSNDTGPYSKSRIRRKDDKPSVRHFQLCTLLSPSTDMSVRSRGNSPSGSRAATPAEDTPSTLPRSGTYLMTPNAYAKLLHNRGECGWQQINDGFLGKFRFNAYPVTTRHEKFAVFSGGVNGGNYLHRGSDVYDEIIIMPALGDKETEGSFDLEVVCNLPFRLEPVALGTVPAPLKDIKNVRLEVITAQKRAKQAAKTSSKSSQAVSSSRGNARGPRGTLAVTINDNVETANLDPLSLAQQVTRRGISEQPAFGIGMDAMPSFNRSVLTSAIKATTSREGDSDGGAMDRTDLFIRQSLQGGIDDIDTAKNDKGRGGPLSARGHAGETSTEVDESHADAGMMNSVTSLARESITSVEPVPARKSAAERAGEHRGRGAHAEPPESIRDQLPTLRKSLAKQIREDTAQRINNITISMWQNESKLETAIKKQYDEEAERSRLGLPRETGTVGGTMFFDPLHERFG